jgi:hypothetical protein
MAYDGATQTVVLFGGTACDGTFCSTLGDTWSWNGTAWREQHPATSPPPRSQGNLAYDGATGQLVLFGGLTTGRALNDTWTWDGTTWTEQHPQSAPSARMEANMAYDDAMRGIVLFAGQNGTFFTDTWEWAGGNWIQIATPPAASNPTSDAYSSMAYQASTQRVVFVDSANDPTRSHTWTFDGRAWAGRNPATNPGWRVFDSLARDDRAGTVVMFGGNNGPSFINETWTWDGSNWTQHFPAMSPPARGSGGATIMTYDAARHVVLLFGGIDAGNHMFGDTWTWDGSTWTQVD